MHGRKDIRAKVPAARDVTITGQENISANEKGTNVGNVPIIKAEDAILASAVFLKYSELRIREFMHDVGGELERLPVEEQFTLVRFGFNSGLGNARRAIHEFFGRQRRKLLVEAGTLVSFRQRRLKDGVEDFSKEKPLRAETVHAAQAIHLSQKIFGIPFSTGDALLFIRF